MADRDRLKEVHQTDLIESRINEDLVEWLKTKGPSWLLMILVGVAIWMGEAWSALLDSRLPGSFEDVAARYADVPGLPQQAKRLGADALLTAVQTDSPLGSDPAAIARATGLTDLEHDEYLQRAERLYQEVIASDDDTLSMTIHAVSALQGMAVVAESLGAEQARKRAATVGQYTAAITLPAQADLPPPPPAEPVTPVVIDEALRDLLLPDVSGQG
jgi:hypothetical protein